MGCGRLADGDSVCLTVAAAVSLARWIHDVGEARAAAEGCPWITWEPVASGGAL